MSFFRLLCVDFCELMDDMFLFFVDLQERHAKGTPWSLEDLSPEQLAVFYRIMLFIPANIYPTITAIDVCFSSQTIRHKPLTTVFFISSQNVS